MYQVANVLIIVISGSIFNAISALIDNPASIVTILGAALPSVSVFFMNYIITQLLSGVVVILFRYVPYIFYKVYVWCFASKSLTRRLFVEGPLAKVTVDYGVELPPLLYILFIMLIYWVMAPILLGIATLFFGATYVAWKYMYMFVCVAETDGGGRFFHGLFEYSMIALMVSALTMIGYTSLKEGIEQAPILLPLPAVIIVCWRYTETKFKTMSLNLPFSAAVDTDVLLPMMKSLKQSSSQRTMNKTASFSSDGSSLPQTASPGIMNPILSKAGVERETSSKSLGTTDPAAASNVSASTAADFSFNTNHYASFTTEFNVQANAKEENPVFPYPYRLNNNEPLVFPATGRFNPIYYAEHEGDQQIEANYLRTPEEVTEIVTESNFKSKPGKGSGKTRSSVRDRGDSAAISLENMEEGKENSSNVSLLTADSLAQHSRTNNPGLPPLSEARPNNESRDNSKDNRLSTGSAYSDVVGPW
jgi:hypothetical protein